MEVLEGCKTSAIEQMMLEIDKFAEDARSRESVLSASSWKKLIGENNSKRGYDSDSMREIADDMASSITIGDLTFGELEREMRSLSRSPSNTREFL